MLGKYEPEKIYYSISEASDMLGIPQATLRLWERNFSEIKPRRSSKGIRLYTKADIETIEKIRDLLKTQGMTMKGAKQLLKNNPGQVDLTHEIATRLKAARDELQAIIDEL